MHSKYFVCVIFADIMSMRIKGYNECKLKLSTSL
jgi:hypothetical protein